MKTNIITVLLTQRVIQLESDHGVMHGDEANPAPGPHQQRGPGLVYVTSYRVKQSGM